MSDYCDTCLSPDTYTCGSCKYNLDFIRALLASTQFGSPAPPPADLFNPEDYTDSQVRPARRMAGGPSFLGTGNVPPSLVPRLSSPPRRWQVEHAADYLGQLRSLGSPSR